MQKVHCDMEECKNSEAYEADVVRLGAPMTGAPKGWAVVQWSADGKGEQSRHTKLMASYLKAMGESLPKPTLGGPHPLGPFAAEMAEAPPALITLRAYVCPDCLGKLALSHFVVVARMQADPPSFFG